jgi:hypothetical protein
VETGHEHKAHAGHIAHYFGTHGDDLAQPGARGQAFVAFAMHFTAQTADAPLLVLQQKILTHKFIPSSLFQNLSWNPTMNSAGKRLRSEVLSPPFLKGDLGGLSGIYLIPPTPL